MVAHRDGTNLMNDFQKLQASPQAFRNAINIDCDGSKKRLSEVMDDWQRKDFRALDDSWKAVIGAGDDFQPRLRAWLERSRGHSKTNDVSVMVTWCLFASKRQLKGFACAADKDQSRLLRDAIDCLVRINPWLGQILQVQQYQVINIKTGSELQILSADAPTSFGLLPDFVICDEVAHWGNRDLFDSMLSSAAKKSHCMLLCISNSGFMESWQWNLRESIRADDSWYFSRLDGPCASWIDQHLLDEQKRLLPRIAYERLWLNKWSSGSGDALSEDEINASICLDGPISKPKHEYRYFGGLDLGLSRDRAAFVVLGIHTGYWSESEIEPQLSDREKTLIDLGYLDEPEIKTRKKVIEGTGEIRLADIQTWDPKKGRIEIADIEETILSLDRKFDLSVGCDPWQAMHLIQRLEKEGLYIESVDFVGKNLTSMCSLVLSAFSDGRIKLYPHDQLIRDLKNLRVIEKSYGVRLDSPRTKGGHGDISTALAISLHTAKNAIPKFTNNQIQTIICE